MQSDLYPGFDVIEPMKIGKPKSDADLQRAMTNGQYFGQIKKDGAFYQIVKNDNGDVGIFGRGISKTTGFFTEKSANVPHIVEWAKECIPNNSNLMTEIYYPGKTSKDTMKVMGCLSDKAITRQQKTGDIHCFVQDCVKWGGQSLIDVAAIERVEYLNTIRGDIDWLEIADVYTRNLPDVLEKAFALGEEGMVFKQKDAFYYPGKRPVGKTIKAKTEDTLDCVITGVVEPLKEYTGKDVNSWSYWEEGVPVTKGYAKNWIAGFSLGAFTDKGDLETFGTVTSGMTDFLRADGRINPQKYLGQTVEIQCMSIDKQERTLRHARLIKFRDDKPAQDCLVKDIF